MTHKELVEMFQDNPVISAVGHEEALKKAIDSPSDIIFLLKGDIFTIKDMVDQCKANNKIVFVHVDLIKGFSKDTTAVKYFKDVVGVHGIISTKVSVLKAAKNMGLFIIQRLFMLDSASYGISVGAVEGLRPDAVEIMPGIIPKIISRICNDLNVLVIAGGMIDEKNEVITGLKAGATSISTSKEELWYV